MAVSLAESFAACRAVVDSAGSSFAVGMRLFPPELRDDVYAVYAFFRHTDDIVDDNTAEADRLAELAAWEAMVTAALEGRATAAGCLPAVADIARRHALPQRLFSDCIDACRGDVGPVRVPDWRTLLNYCDGVAGTVGEACLRILGYVTVEAFELSRENARAVQLTNILRDIDEDLSLDRVYLPFECFARHGAELAELYRTPLSSAARGVLEEVADRAEEAYRTAEPLFDLLAPEHRPALVAMTHRYRLLLDRCRSGEHIGHGRPSSRGTDRLRTIWAATMSRWTDTWRRS